jgi:hypothetical protein
MVLPPQASSLIGRVGIKSEPSGVKTSKRLQNMPRISPANPSQPADPALIASLARLWPHREHESCCRSGLHRWRQLDLSELYPGKEVHFCFWCSKIRVDGMIHEP